MYLLTVWFIIIFWTIYLNEPDFIFLHKVIYFYLRRISLFTIIHLFEHSKMVSKIAMYY